MTPFNHREIEAAAQAAWQRVVTQYADTEWAGRSRDRLGSKPSEAVLAQPRQEITPTPASPQKTKPAPRPAPARAQTRK
jgi:hypothetical protein